MLKKFFTIFFFILLNNAYAQEKIAFIDVNYILNNSNAGKEANKQIEIKQKKLTSEFEKFKKKINTEKKTLSNQKNVISKEEYGKKLMDLEKEIQEYNSKISKKNNELLNYKAKSKTEFTKNLKPILAEYSKENSISMILRKENLLIGKTELDVTEGILELFNKKVKKLSLN
jgi:outer membrane protein